MTDENEREVLILLQDCLNQLDKLGAPIAAAHLDAAIQQALIEFNLDRLPSISD